MQSWKWATLAALVASPAQAQTSIGYAYSHILEEGGEGTALGAYLSLASASGRPNIEFDLGYHRDSESLGGVSAAQNLFTAVIGPRFALDVGSEVVDPFLHVLGGGAMSYLTVSGTGTDFDGSDTSFAAGGMIGGGADISAAPSLVLHLGVDLQVFYDEGESTKLLRLVAGLAF